MLLIQGLPGLKQTCAILLVTLAASAASAPLAWSYRSGNYLWAVAVSRDGMYAIAGSDDMHAYFFETQSAKGEPLWSHEAQGYVRDVAISWDGSRVVTSDTNGSIFFFQPRISGRPTWSYHAESSIEALAMSDDGGYVAAGDRNGHLYIFRADQDAPLSWRNTIPGGVLALSFSESQSLAVTSARGGIYFFDETTPQSSYSWCFQESTSFPHVAMADDASYVVAGASDGLLYLLGRTGQLVDSKRLGGAISSLSVSDTARRVAAGNTKGVISIYEIQTGLNELKVLETEGPVTSIALSDNGERILLANLDGTISMFDQSLTTPLWRYGTDAIVHSLSISADGRIMAAGSDTGSIYLFAEKEAPGMGDAGAYLFLVPVLFIVITVVLFASYRRRKR